VEEVREFSKEGPRAEGAAVVWSGREDGPALVVIDPSGAARHEELPATWDRLGDHFQVAWCRLPASTRSLEDIEDVLETLAERNVSVNIVASGQACTAAIAIAPQFSDMVSAVLLVDPLADEGATKLDDIEVHVIARSHDGATDRIDAPLPLGHPEVVSGLVSTLATMT
jgi:hypothetical protein